MNPTTSLPLPASEPTRSVFADAYKYHLGEVAQLVAGARKFRDTPSTHTALLTAARKHSNEIRQLRNVVKEIIAAINAAHEVVRSFSLTGEDCEEVRHKLCVLCDTDDLKESYDITNEDAETLRDSVPREGGTWDVPVRLLSVVCGEMQDHAVILRDIAANARSNRETGQALRIDKQAKKFENMFAL